MKHGLLLLLLFILDLGVSLQASTPAPLGPKILPPKIQTVSRGNNRWVVVIPYTHTQLVIEQRSGTGWKPIEVQHLQFKSVERQRVIPIKLPRGVALSQVRYVAYPGGKFPTRFTTGLKSFQRTETEAQDNVIFHTGVNPLFTIFGTLPSMARLSSNSITAQADALTTTAPEAVESDIWKLVGNRLYFFNQYRGLQIYDLQDPVNPVRLGGLRLAASGEQMFVLNPEGTSVALLGRSQTQERSGQSALFIMTVTQGVPELVQEIPVLGYAFDSRLIGNRLHVVSQTYNYENYLTSYIQTHVQTIDLSDPLAPRTTSVLQLDGSCRAVQAVNGYLLVGTTSNYTYLPKPSKLHVIQTLTESGNPVLVKSLTPKAQVMDKFKVNIVNEAIVVVSNPWGTTGIQTWVETFPLAGTETTPLAQIELESARGDTLHATRFDGNRLYAVTFQRTDPFYVVDLTQPAAPVILGELEIPGWSTYIEPMGDRLLAVGIENNRVAVSLFDVQTPSAPTLLSRLLLGPENGYTTSEGNFDPKAIEYFAAERIVMVPFQNYSNGQSSYAMQTIHIGDAELTLGTTLQHEGAARRGAVLGDHLISISGQELIVHARGNSQNTPAAQLSLAWRVDRVLPLGADALIQIENGFVNHYIYYNYTASQATLRVTRRNDPDALLEEIDLGTGQVIGMTQQGNRLFVGQWIQSQGLQPAKLRTWVLDVSVPSSIRLITSVEHSLLNIDESRMHFEDAQPLWTDANTLVWYLPHYTYKQSNFVNPGLVILQPGIIIGRPAIISSPGLISLQPGMTLVASTQDQPVTSVRTTSSATPQLFSATVSLSTTVRPLSSLAAMLCPIHATQSTPVARTSIPIQSDGVVRDSSKAITQNGFIFLSYDTVTSEATSDGYIQIWNISRLRLRSWLRVVDFRASNVVVRDPASIPGPLVGLHQADAQGAILLTKSDASASFHSPATLQASAYDGIQVFQLDTHEIETYQKNCQTSDGARFYYVGDGQTVVGIGYDSASGLLNELNQWRLTTPPQGLQIIGSYMLANSTGNLETATLSSSGLLTPAAQFDTPTNINLLIQQTANSPEGLWIPAMEYGVEFLPHAQLQP